MVRREGGWWSRTGSVCPMGRWSLLLLGLCWVGWPGEASAQVPRIQGQGTAASAMSNAYAAQADDPSALYYNPAGMTQLQGVQLMAGALISGGSTNFTSLAGVNARGYRKGGAASPMK